MWFVGIVRQHCPPKSSERVSSGSESGSAAVADGSGTDCGLNAGTPMGPQVPAAAATLDMTDLEWRLEDVIVAVENAMWDTAEEAEAGAAAEGPAGPEDDEEGGSNLKGRYRFNGDGALGGGS